MNGHTTSIRIITDSKTGETSGYRSSCACGWRGSFTVSRTIAESDARTHRGLASRKRASR